MFKAEPIADIASDWFLARNSGGSLFPTRSAGKPTFEKCGNIAVLTHRSTTGAKFAVLRRPAIC